MKLSEMELYIIQKNGDVVKYYEFANAHRGSMLLWTIFADRYLDNKWAFDQFLVKDKTINDSFWGLVKQKEVPKVVRIVLGSTYDNVMVKKENLPELIKAMQEVTKMFNDTGHLKAQIEVLEKILNTDILGVCWNQTSVGSVWSARFLDDDNLANEIRKIIGDDTSPLAIKLLNLLKSLEDGIPFNIFRDENPSGKSWFLFDRDWINNPPLDTLDECRKKASNYRIENMRHLE